MGQQERKWGRFPVVETARQIVEDAQNEVEQLLEELTEWMEKMEGTNLENSQKYEELQEAVDSLEQGLSSLQEVDVEDVPEMLLEYLEERRRRPPRHVRLSNALAGLHEIINFYQEGSDTCPEWVAPLEEAVEILEAVDFPGMY